MILSLDQRLDRLSRLPGLAAGRERVGALELATLILAGAAAAAAATFVHVLRGVPGHQIVFSIFPMALGLALVPRRTAGSVMGGSATGTLLLFHAIGVHTPGLGAVTSLVVIGPILDLAVRWGRDGARLYATFIAGGATANAIAFVVRGTAMLMGVRGLGGGRGFDAWLPQALWTYALAGFMAGLISAGAWFQLRPRKTEPPGQ